MTFPSLVLVGAGNMGGALLRGWLEREGAAERITVVDPVAAIDGVRCVKSPADADVADVVVVAVKPQLMAQVLPTLGALAGPDSVVVSVAAGTLMTTIAPHFAADTALVRVMPNTPSQVGQGASVCVANTATSGAQREAVSDLMAAVGTVDWVENESQMDAVTGLSGSGPAYVFHMIEALAAAGEAEGLDAALAMRLAVQTVRGAGALAAQADDDAATLRKNVTSPNGTTAAGLDVLMAELPDLMARTVAAAAHRSKDLAND